MDFETANQLSGQPRGAFQILRSDGDENPISDPNWDYDFQCYFLYQPRPDLYRRIDLRCEQMIEGTLDLSIVLKVCGKS